jgi:hypothetical protein
MPEGYSGCDFLNYAQAVWAADAGTPETGTGQSFVWTAPDEACSVTIAVLVPDMGQLADDPTHALASTTVSCVVPEVSSVWFLDYWMRESEFAETDEHHTWSCSYWYYGEHVPVAQYDETQTPMRNEPVYMVGGESCPAWVSLHLEPDLYAACGIETKSEWGDFAGFGYLYTSDYTPTAGTFVERPQQVDEFLDQPIKWYYRVPTPYGSNNWIEMDTTTHGIYQSFDQPCGDPPAAKKRVDNVCTVAEDQGTVEGIAGGITEWVAGELYPGALGGSLDPEVDPWCYLDDAARPLECDDQAQVACHVLALTGVLAQVALVRASTDRLTCVGAQLENRYCDECHLWEVLWLYDGSFNAFEGCCFVVDEGDAILYAIWDGTGTVKKAKETEVTNNPPDHLAAAGLAMLNKLTTMHQVWAYYDEEGVGDVAHTNVPKPPLN